MEKFTLPAGKYYLGDPCYSFQNHDNWLKALEESDYFDVPLVRDGLTAIAFDTAYGDGTYEDQNGNEYPVDAGLIGLVPATMADCVPTGVKAVEFTEPIECHTDGALLYFGPYTIDTDPRDVVEHDDDGDDDYDAQVDDDEDDNG